MEEKWDCPFCDFTYNSEGGYYGHLRQKHGVGRNGKKLSTTLIEQMSKEVSTSIDHSAKHPADGTSNGDGSTEDDDHRSTSKNEAQIKKWRRKTIPITRHQKKIWERRCLTSVRFQIAMT